MIAEVGVLGVGRRQPLAQFDDTTERVGCPVPVAEIATTDSDWL